MRSEKVGDMGIPIHREKINYDPTPVRLNSVVNASSHKTPFSESRPNEELATLGKDESQLHLIVDMTRLGAALFNVRTEYTHFPPRTPKNKLYNMRILKWPHLGTNAPQFTFSIASIPLEFRPTADEIAKECGLRLANGVPVFVNAEGAHLFPMDGPTVFTLENVGGHDVYRNKPQEYMRIYNEERDEMERIFAADRQRMVAELRVQGFTGDQIERLLAEWANGNEDYDETPQHTPDGPHRHNTPR